MWPISKRFKLIGNIFTTITVKHLFKTFQILYWKHKIIKKNKKYVKNISKTNFIWEKIESKHLAAQQIQKIKQQKNNGYKKINDDNSLSLSNT